MDRNLLSLCMGDRSFGSQAQATPYTIHAQLVARGSIHASELDIEGEHLFLVGQDRHVWSLDVLAPKPTLKL